MGINEYDELLTMNMDLILISTANVLMLSRGLQWYYLQMPKNFLCLKAN